MKTRIDYKAVAPDAFSAMYGLERYVRECGLEQLPSMVGIAGGELPGGPRRLFARRTGRSCTKDLILGKEA
jgi:hypothetical protein